MAKTETAAAESKIKEHVRTLADKLKAEITLDKKTGVAVVTEGAYAKLLPDGLDIETVKKIAEHNQTLVAAGTLALGEVSIPVMKKNDDLTRTTLTVPITGKDYMGFAFDRTKEVRAPGSDTTTTKYGTSQAEIVTYGTKNRGDLAKVKDELAELALSAFGGK